MKLDFAMIATMLSAFGEDTVRRMLTIPYAKAEAQAKRNKDDVSEMIAKRDTWVDATIDLAREWANLDND